MSHQNMDESVLEAPGEPSGEGGRLFVDLGVGAGAVPVRADAGKAQFLRSSHTAVIAFMVALAAGGIWGMRALGLGVRSAAADVPEIERAVQPTIAAEKFNALMTELERGDRPVQIPPSRLSSKSPFELERPPVEVAAAAPGETEAERQARLEREAQEEAERAAAVRQQAVDRELARLRVFAVVGGRVPAARINTSIVRQGDVVAKFFTVVEIKDRSVVLECDGEQYELELAGKSGG